MPMCVLSVYQPYGSYSHQMWLRLLWRHVNYATHNIPLLSHLTPAFLPNTVMDACDRGLTPPSGLHFVENLFQGQLNTRQGVAKSVVKAGLLSGVINNTFKMQKQAADSYSK